jgi:hypothetical protein
MDILSHGLWGGAVFGRKSRKSFWIAFAAGILPDILVFGPHFVQSIFRGFDFGPPDANIIPSNIYNGYELTHSLVIFIVVFGLVWFFRHRPMWELGAWGLHILMDIPTHSTSFFPTPFLWPIADVRIDGHPWSSPEIFIPNVILLVIIYTLWWRRKPKTDTTVSTA